MIQVVVATYIMTDNDRIVTGAPINISSYVMPCGISFTINKGKKKIRMRATRGYNGDEIDGSSCDSIQIVN